jgi:preprotein translocase subunit SecB
MKSFIIIMMIISFIFPLARLSVASEVQRGERPDIDLTQVPDDAIIPGRIQNDSVIIGTYHSIWKE